jgi:quinolinate synthase
VGRARAVHRRDQPLKRQRNAVLLAHNYQTPEIFHGVADITGDSLALARRRRDRRRGHRPVRRALHGRDRQDPEPGQDGADPRPEAGCSLAESITGADVRLLRQRYPGVPVVTYVNTSAEVKAESDICCTSGNAVEVVESLGTTG